MRVLNKLEQNYSVTERECLAVIYAVKQFRVYVHGVHFQVVTNHSLLKWLQSLKEPERRLARWALSLQAYDLEIKHQPGAIHHNADCLSRLPMIAVLSPEADRLYELLNKPDLWKLELREIQESLKLLSQNVSRKNGSLYKKISKV